jgi:hypothetical protein
MSDGVGSAPNTDDDSFWATTNLDHTSSWTADVHCENVVARQRYDRTLRLKGDFAGVTRHRR